MVLSMIDIAIKLDCLRQEILDDVKLYPAKLTKEEKEALVLLAKEKKKVFKEASLSDRTAMIQADKEAKLALKQSIKEEKQHTKMMNVSLKELMKTLKGIHSIAANKPSAKPKRGRAAKKSVKPASSLLEESMEKTAMCTPDRFIRVDSSTEFVTSESIESSSYEKLSCNLIVSAPTFGTWIDSIT